MHEQGVKLLPSIATFDQVIVLLAEKLIRYGFSEFIAHVKFTSRTGDRLPLYASPRVLFRDRSCFLLLFEKDLVTLRYF